jgi:hypothetical protein
MLSVKTACFNEKDSKYGIAYSWRFGSFTDRMKAYAKNGGELWTYICWEPGSPYANMFVNESGLDHRIALWQQYDIGSCGFLYWSATYWEFVKNDPWESMATVPWLGSNNVSPVHGDGVLLYPGESAGIKGPCGSIRFFAVRDGVEDVMLLKLAEEKFGRSWVDQRLDKITTSMVSFTTDYELFASIRTEIGNALNG